MRRRTVAWLAALFVGSAGAQTEPAPDALPDALEAETVGFDYWLGRGVAQDFATAARWLEQAAGAGRPNAAAALAGLYQRGQGVPRDPARAHELNVQAALQGIAVAQAALGLEAEALEPGSGLPWLNAAAEQEDALALALLGQLYRFGVGVERNTELGRRFVMRAAELGYPPAGAEAGRLLLEGEPARGDVVRGLYFLRAAAQAGFGPGAYWLGYVHLTGRHVERDAGLAVQWLTRASELKVPVATLWLAELYVKGSGVATDAARAAELRAQALPAMSLGERNGFAWALAVSPDAALRNGAFAVEIMEIVTRELPSPAYLDTLAAAYAEEGRFDAAVRTQQRALDALPSNVQAAVREPYAERAALYRSGQPYREAQ